MKDLLKDKVSQVLDLAMRINLETDLCSFVEVSGHVDQIKISVRQGKDDFNKRIHSVELRYRPWSSYEKEEEFCEKFNKDLDLAIKDLQNIVSSKWEYTYTAYCNLIDMACSEVFSSDEQAQKWKRKMERKYKSVHPICGVNKEIRKSDV